MQRRQAMKLAQLNGEAAKKAAPTANGQWDWITERGGSAPTEQ
jgi:hypothetical protein